MNFIKRQSLGAYLGCMVLVAAALGEVYYAINQRTATFGNLDKNLVVILGGGAAILIELALLILGQRAYSSLIMNIILDLARPLVSILLIWSATVFVTDRVNTFASVLTFSKNAQSMADMHSAIVGIIAFFLAAFLSLVSAFFRISKRQ